MEPVKVIPAAAIEQSVEPAQFVGIDDPAPVLCHKCGQPTSQDYVIDGQPWCFPCFYVEQGGE